MAAVVTLCVLAAMVVVWCGWRLASRRAVLPCPSELKWLVELENPIARATRSAAIVGHLAAQPGERILDIGCGPGRVTLPLARAVTPRGEVIAVDVQDEMLATVRAKAAAESLSHLRYIKLHAGTGALEVEHADAAVLVMMLGEVTEPLALLTSVRAALKDRGRLLVVESIFDPHYVRRRKLVRLAESAGFESVSARGNCLGYSLLFRKRDAVAGETATSLGLPAAQPHAE